MQARQEWCDNHFEDDFRGVVHGDEKLFILRGGTGWQYVKTEDGESPEFDFVTDKHHPKQVMVTAWVARPNPDKGFDGKVALGLSYPEGQEGGQEFEPAGRHVGARPEGDAHGPGVQAGDG